MMPGSIWNVIDEVNEELKKVFLCVPLYQCVNGEYLKKLAEHMKAGTDVTSVVRGSINLPWQRAYQVEFRYRKCSVFKPYLPVIECATYCAMEGNWICAYLSFLPVVEAVMRKWSEEDKSLSFGRMRTFVARLIAHLKEQEFFPMSESDGAIAILNTLSTFWEKSFTSILNSTFRCHSQKCSIEILRFIN